MSEWLDERKAKYMALSMVVSFLLIHISLLLLFLRFGVTPMARFNVLSILFYVAILPVSERLGYHYFGMAVYLEVLLHMTGAAVFTGWDSGFQDTIIGINILVFYNEYVMRRLKEPYVKALPLALLGMSDYLFICVYTHLIPARYPMPADVCFWLRFIWGVVIFGIVIAYLLLFVRQTSGSEEFLFNAIGHDKLTGLPNRYYLSDYLASLQSGGGLDGHWCAMADIDDFKAINDTCGHNCGDYILREVADLLRGMGDTVQIGRWGGEEFLVFGSVGDDPEAGLRMLDALRVRIMEHRFLFQGQELHVTVTLGYAEYRHGSSIHDWINTADKKMYEGKRSGKNRLTA